MNFVETINDSNKSFLFKTKTTGPLSLENYKNIKLESNKKDKEFISYFINWIRQNNHYIYRVIEINKFYIVDKSTVITDNYLICINRIPKNIKKRKKIETFGISNDDFGYTTSRSHSRVFIVPPDIDEKEFSKKMNKIYDEYDKRITYISLDKFNEEIFKETKIDNKNNKSNYSKLSKITDNITSKNINSKFKIFKPNIAALNMLDRINKRSNDATASKGSYVPPGARNKSSGSCTIVIKNIPVETELSVKEINNNLRKIFEQYGMIDRVKTLTSRENNEIIIKGIAFIDFYDSKSVDKVLSDSTSRHRIGYSILHVEKKNN